MTLPRLAMHLLASLLIAPGLFPAADAAGRGAGLPMGTAEPTTAATRGSVARASPAASPGRATVADATTPATDAAPLWLRGAFGRVAGGSLTHPGSAAPSAQPLDTFVVRAPLLLELPDVPGITLDRVVAMEAPWQLPVVTPGHSPAPPDPILSGGVEPTVLWSQSDGRGGVPEGAIVFEGPGEPGTTLLVAELTTSSGSRQVAWLLLVPDREPPEGDLYDIPAPGIVVSSAGSSRTGRAANGCYAFLCVDVGHAPPTAVLPSLPARVDEPLQVRLSDGSAMVGWSGRLSPLDMPRRPTLDASAGPGGPDDVMQLSGLAVPAAGRWLLDLEVEFDRERGWMRTFLVIDARGR
jgi:hypothetical protein